MSTPTQSLSAQSDHAEAQRDISRAMHELTHGRVNSLTVINALTFLDDAVARLKSVAKILDSTDSHIEQRSDIRVGHVIDPSEPQPIEGEESPENR